MAHLATPKNPIRDVLQQMTGCRPPKYVRGYSLSNLSDKESTALQDWAVNKVQPTWLTGIGLLEAAEQQVEEAVFNGNIPPEISSEATVMRRQAVYRLLQHVRGRYERLLRDLERLVLEQGHR